MVTTEVLERIGKHG